MADTGASAAPTTAAAASPPFRSPILAGWEVDQAEWMCHAILQQQQHEPTADAGAALREFDQLESILPLVAPIRHDGPLGIRLKIIAVWYEFLTALVGSKVVRKQNDDTQEKQNQKQPTVVMPPPPSSSSMEVVQDKLMMLHKEFFDRTLAERQFEEVVELLRVHAKLEELHQAVGTILKDDSDDNDYDVEAAVRQLLDECQEGWQGIYLAHNRIPAALQLLTDKHRDDMTPAGIQQEITCGIITSHGKLSLVHLQTQLRQLLLHWCENEIDGGLPELVRLGYRGATIKKDSTNSAGTTTTLRTPTSTTTTRTRKTPPPAVATAAAAIPPPRKVSNTPNNTDPVATASKASKPGAAAKSGAAAAKKGKVSSVAAASRRSTSQVHNGKRKDAEYDGFGSDASSSDDNGFGFKGYRKPAARRIGTTAESSSEDDFGFSRFQPAPTQASKSPTRSTKKSTLPPKLRTPEKNDASSGCQYKRSTPKVHSTPASRKRSQGDDDSLMMSSIGSSTPGKKRRRWTTKEDDVVFKGLRKFRGHKNKYAMVMSEMQSMGLNGRNNVQIKDRVRTLKKQNKLPEDLIDIAANE